jgi:LacI family transcriptional regulator
MHKMIDVNHFTIDANPQGFGPRAERCAGNKMNTPTLTDVARKAGVSYATADRVVNARGGVAVKSVDKVQRAVAELGYVRNLAAANLSTQREFRFAFVIPSQSNSFFRHIHGLLGTHTSTTPGQRQNITIIDVEAFEPAALQHVLRGLQDEGFDGVAVVGIASPGVEAQLAALRAKGVATLSFISDITPSARLAYIGIDNIMAGRTAARLIGMAHGGQAGLVQPIIGSLSLRDHQDRLRGFYEVLSRDFPRLTIRPEIAGRDSGEVVERHLSAALQTAPTISAIYNIGGGSSGISRLFTGRANRPFTVIHDLMPHTRTALEAGLIDVVIDQRPEEEIDRALSLMHAAANRLPVAECPPITLAIYLPDNLPTPHPSPKEHAL